MKNILPLFFLFITHFSFGQINPVQNLVWEQTYDEMSNIFSLTWEEPAIPHDELLGYNIYREEELYRFQTETSLGYHPLFGGDEDEDFIYYNNGDPFTGYVAAVYEGGIESEYVSFETEGTALNIINFEIEKAFIYPNPVTEELNFSEKLKNIKIIDSTGKVIFAKDEATTSINLNSFVGGIYWLKAQRVSGKFFHQKFVKK